MRIITIYNSKGGVGKTTLAVNLAAALARQGKSVLLLDNDPQADATLWTASHTHTELLEDYYEKEIGGINYTVNPFVSDVFGIDIIPCSTYLLDIETMLSEIGAKGNTILSKVLDKIANNYDYVLIDNMPTFSHLIINSMVASDYVIIPTQPSYLSASRIKNVLGYIEKVRGNYNSKLSVLGIAIMMGENRTNYRQGMLASIRKSYSMYTVFACVVPYSVRVPESTYYHVPALRRKNAKTLADSFNGLAMEVIYYDELI